MDFLRPSAVWALRTLAATLTVTTLTGCSGSSKALGTPAQAAGFVAAVAAGEPYDDWKLASDASRQAVEAWAARATIGELGRKLRDAPLPPSGAGRQEPGWTCAMAYKLVSLGAVGSVTSFNNDDIGYVTKEALQAGITQSQISAMIHDASTVPFRDLALATAAACGPQVS